MRGLAAAAHYLGVESQATTFSEEATALRAAVRVSATDAICRISRLRRAFTAEADLMRERLQRMEAADAVPGRRVTRRMIRWFWCGLVLVSAAAFAAGYLVGLGH